VGKMKRVRDVVRRDGDQGPRTMSLGQSNALEWLPSIDRLSMSWKNVDAAPDANDRDQMTIDIASTLGSNWI